PEIGLFGVVTSLPKEGEPQRADTFRAVGEALARTGMPGVIFPQLEQEPTDTVRRAKQEAGVPLVLSGLERFVSSAAHLGRWSRWWGERTRYAPRDQQPGGGRPLQVPDGPLSEHDARELLPTAGIPVVPAKLAATANEAVEMAASFDSPVVLKVCSAAIAQDRKSTRLNSSHVKISYAVFCLKKKK